MAESSLEIQLSSLPTTDNKYIPEQESVFDKNHIKHLQETIKEMYKLPQVMKKVLGWMVWSPTSEHWATNKSFIKKITAI